MYAVGDGVALGLRVICIEARSTASSDRGESRRWRFHQRRPRDAAVGLAVGPVPDEAVGPVRPHATQRIVLVRAEHVVPHPIIPGDVGVALVAGNAL